MATRKELLSSLSTLGQGLSVMQDRMKAAKSFEQEQADKEAERKYLDQYRPKTLQVQDQNIERGKLGLEDEKIKLEGSQKLKAARDAMDAQIAGEWGFVGPEDVGSVNGWRAELAILNRGSDKAISPQEFYRAKKSAMQADTRAQEAHASAMATDRTQRELYGAQAERQKADAARAGTAPVKPPRDLSDGGIKAIGEQGTKLLNVHSIVNSFKPQFTGQLTGGLSNTVGKITGGNIVGANPEQVGWWENYQGFVNQVRNELFGAALTPGEKAEFEKTVVKPNTDPKVAQANLLRQWDIVKGATERNANTYAAGNVNRDQIGAALGGSYDPESGKIGLRIDWDTRQGAGGASGSWDDDEAAADAVFGPSSSGGSNFDFQRFKKGRQ